MKYRFYKENDYWFIDIKWWPKALKPHLAMVCGANILLEKLAEGKDEIYLLISTKRKENYRRLLRLEKLGLFKGAIYQPRDINIQNDVTGENWLWLCFVTMFVFGRYPKEIFYKVL